MQSVRLRDFIEDREGCLYAVSNYDNAERIGCILRYVPDAAGERTNCAGRRYHKYDFAESFDWVRAHRPEYLDNVQGVDSVWFTELALAHPGCADAATAASSALQRSGRPVVLGRVYPPLTR